MVCCTVLGALVQPALNAGGLPPVQIQVTVLQAAPNRDVPRGMVLTSLCHTLLRSPGQSPRLPSLTSVCLSGQRSLEPSHEEGKRAASSWPLAPHPVLPPSAFTPHSMSKAMVDLNLPQRCSREMALGCPKVLNPKSTPSYLHRHTCLPVLQGSDRLLRLCFASLCDALGTFCLRLTVIVMVACTPPGNAGGRPLPRWLLCPGEKGSAPRAQSFNWKTAGCVTSGE